MKLPTKVKLKAAKRKVPRGTGAVLAAITGFAAGAGAVLRGREAVQKAATVVLDRAERKKG
jgi:hypothetical protein